MTITPEEVEAARRRLGFSPARSDQQQQAGFQQRPREPVPAPVQQKPTRGGVGGFVRRLTKPLVDIPDLPGGKFGEVVEQGIESVISPIGLISTALIPVTGGASLGLRGAAGVAAKVGTRLGAEVAAGGAAGLAAEEVGQRLEGAPGYLRIPATLGAAALAGGATGVAASRALGRGAVKMTAEQAAEAAARQAEQATAGLSPAASTIMTAVSDAKLRMKDPEIAKALKQQISSERQAKVGAAIEASGGPGVRGIEAIRAFRGAQRGTETRLDFPSLDIPESAMDDLADELLRSNRLSPLEKPNAFEAIEKAILGTAPTPYEIKLLERHFGPAFAQTLTKDPSVIGTTLGLVTNLPRALLATLDLSFPLNQGLLAAPVSPKAWGESINVAFKAAISPEYAKYQDDLARGVAGTPVQRAIRDKLIQADLHITGGSTKDDIFAVAENSMERYLKNNIAGGLIRGSERGYTTPGNFLRSNIAGKTVERMARDAAGAGADEAAILKALERLPYKDVKKVTDTVNILTGRSTLLRGKKGAQYAPALNALLFAPNYMISRFQMLGLPAQSLYRVAREQGLGSLANPAAVWKSEPALQIQMKALGGMVAEGVAIMAAYKIAKEAGVLPEDLKIEVDPRSTRFGKIQLGDTQIDMWGGYSQIAGTVARVISGQQKAASGAIRELPRTEAIWDKFVRSKTAPWPGLAWDIKTGKTYTGERLSGEPDVLDSALRERFLPLAMQDIIDGYLEHGATGVGKAAPALLGARLSTYRSIGQMKDDISQEKFQKPYGELDRSQRDRVDNDTRVLDKQREYDIDHGQDFSEAAANIQLERSQAENALFSRLASQLDTVDEFAEGVEEAQLRASEARNREAERFGLQPAEKNSLFDVGYQEWLGLYDLADKGLDSGVKTNQVDFNRFSELEAALFKRLTPEQVQFIEERKLPTHDPSVEWYFNNKRYINGSGYYDIMDTEFTRSPAARQFDSYGALIAAYDAAVRSGDEPLKKRLRALKSPIDKRASDKKKTLRRKDPQLDAALISIGRADKAVTNAAVRLLRQ